MMAFSMKLGRIKCVLILSSNSEEQKQYNRVAAINLIIDR